MINANKLMPHWLSCMFVLATMLTLNLASAQTSSPATSHSTLNLDASASPPIWLMGEVHDNAEGHRLRFSTLEKNLDQGWRPSLVLEQLDREQETTVQNALKNCSNADCFIQQVNLNNWDWSLYKDLIDLALRYRLTIVPANLSRKDASLVMKQGFEASLPAHLVNQLQLNLHLPDFILSAQIKAVDEGHCQQLPSHLLAPMAKAQIARDVWMAWSITQALQSNSQGVVLIAGNGHTRKDIGVYQWMSPNLQVNTLSFGFVENPDALASELYDKVIAIEPVPRPDLCESFQKQ